MLMPSTTEEDLARASEVRFEGTVTNAVTGAGISGATVAAQGFSTLSDDADRGAFVLIIGLRPGVFPVSVRHERHVSVQRDVTFVPKPGVTVASFQLQPSPAAP
jgi:hypothetical protein